MKNHRNVGDGVLDVPQASTKNKLPRDVGDAVPYEDIIKPYT